ncbi:MAG TPA: RimK/LysX family protein, partial [Desulfobaccales bacterium]|nr:RimK/LysX family protein [Desulfobaccales bacterium]
HFNQAQKRPVIKIGVCLGRIYKETEVNLVDRTGFKYRMLIGRKFMEGAVIIDPAVKYTIEPSCSEPASLE